jgi:hypothetical protein
LPAVRRTGGAGGCPLPEMETGEEILPAACFQPKFAKRNIRNSDDFHKKI